MFPSLPIPPVQLPFYHQVAILLINFVFAALLLAVFNHNRFRDRISRIFVGMGVSMLLWVDFAYLARIFGTQPDLSEMLLRIAWVATPPTFYFTYLTSLAVMKRERHHQLERRIFFGTTFATSVITAFTDLIITGAEYTNQNLDIVYGAGFFPFLTVIALLMFATLRPLFRTKLQRSARMFLLGVGIFYFLNMVFNITLPVFFRISYLYVFGDYSTILLLACTSYAILRHELFQIKIVATEAITGLLWIVLLSKLLISESSSVAVVDGLIFLLAIVFGVFLVRSVLREVRQRERLQALSRRLTELDKQKDEFLSVAAHELRAPMTAIKGYLSMVMDGDAGPVTAETKEYLLRALEGNDRLIRLVNNMLNVARIEEGRMVFSLGDIPLMKVVREVFEEFRSTAMTQGLSYVFEAPESLDDIVTVDRDRIYEVVSNYVSNAIKYTETGTVTVKVRNLDPDRIRVEVVDTGSGLSKSEIGTLFGKFVRAESSASKAVGTGLGLYISKLLIEKFGGTLGVLSEKGKGSTFWFELPVKKV